MTAGGVWGDSTIVVEMEGTIPVGAGGNIGIVVVAAIATRTSTMPVARSAN
jgi:hypothetical protein